jgi:hypothetical protein
VQTKDVKHETQMERTMTTATKILRAVAKLDKSTSQGRKVIRLNRGKFEKLFLSCSEEIHDSAMRTFDRTVK